MGEGGGGGGGSSLVAKPRTGEAKTRDAASKPAVDEKTEGPNKPG